MNVEILPVGPILTNCYLVTCEESSEAVLIDPGWDDHSIRDAIAVRRAVVQLVVNTHAHWDHIGGNAVFVQDTGAQLAIHELELPLLEARGGADLWNIPIRPSPPPDRLLRAGDSLEVGNLRFDVLFTPGHTAGHISLYEESNRAVFDGDVLFNRGIGRTDLPGGNLADLTRSIREVLYALPDEVRVFPGHGEPTTIGEERQGNPWIPG